MEPFTVAGPGFSASGTHRLSPINPLDFPYPPGVNTLHIPGTTSDLNLTMDLTVRGVPFGLPPGPDGGEAQSIFHGAPVVLSGPGTFFGTFTYFGSFIGVPLSVISANPGKTCRQLICSSFLIDGGGAVTYDVVPFPQVPGALEISTATFSFQAPEPSTTSLLLVAFAGLAIEAGCRRLRARLCAAGGGVPPGQARLEGGG
jgi:hypothetical protein